jgi:pyridoxamine 5'-phosphate oxidase
VDFEDPIDRFGRIFQEAVALDRKLLPDPTAMTVASVGAGGQPSIRVVLLKSYDRDGFVFYTNFEGRKGRELLANPLAALCFHWPHLEVQVRIEGRAKPVSDAEADAYFASRPRASQLGAWASQQSRPIEHEGDLETRLAEYETKFEGRDVPRPQYWSGFRVTPERIEFWHNRPSRLHLRHLYTRQDDGWKMDTLYP